MREKRRNATTPSTKPSTQHGAAWRVMARSSVETPVKPIIVAPCLSHNAGVGSSSLPPATRLKAFCINTMQELWAFVLRMGLQGSGTKPGTTDHEFRETERRNRVLFALSVRDVQHRREQVAIRLALRSGTAGKLLG